MFEIAALIHVLARAVTMLVAMFSTIIQFVRASMVIPEIHLSTVIQIHPKVIVTLEKISSNALVNKMPEPVSFP